MMSDERDIVVSDEWDAGHMGCGWGCIFAGAIGRGMSQRRFPGGMGR